MIIAYPMLPIAAGALLAFFGATAVGCLAVSAGFPLPAVNRRIGCIDGLRGYLALSVLVHHFVIWVQITRLGYTWSAPTVNVLNNLGAGGVALFFMTTGLVFYPRILAGFSTTSWVATYTARVFRIVPLVVVSVLMITLIIMTRTGARPDLAFLKDAAKWITAWAQVPLLDYADSGRLDAYVLWSLWYEWIFYISVLPICALAMDAVRHRLPSWTIPAALLVISLAARDLPSLQSLSLHGLQKLPYYLPLFAIGMLAYEVQHSPSLKKRLQGPAAAVIAFCSLAVGMVSAPNPYAIPQLILFAVFFTVVACGNSLAGLLRTKGALALGECSYGIYMLHGIVLSLLFVEGVGFLRGLTTDQNFFVLPVVAIVIACITLSTYVVVERPMIAVGSRVVRALIGRKIGIERPQAEVAP